MLETNNKKRAPTQCLNMSFYVWTTRTEVGYAANHVTTHEIAMKQRLDAPSYFDSFLSRPPGRTVLKRVGVASALPAVKKE